MTVKRWAWVGRLPLFKPSDEQLARVKRWAKYGAYAGAGLGFVHTEAHTRRPRWVLRRKGAAHPGVRRADRGLRGFRRRIRLSRCMEREPSHRMSFLGQGSGFGRRPAAHREHGPTYGHQLRSRSSSSVISIFR